MTGAMKEAFKESDLGVGVAGGKGRTSRRAPAEIEALGRSYGLSDHSIKDLVKASKLSAKVDSAAVQDQHQLYHHAFVLSEDGSWVVIQQGMNPDAGYARRYHWYWRGVERFVESPHGAILGRRVERALDMTSRESAGSRRISVEVAREGPRRIRRLLQSLRDPGQESLRRWTGEEDPFRYFSIPRRLNWNALRNVYEFRPSDYEELLGLPGVGPATVRALAYISEAIHGTEPSWSDPVKYSFALGGKDGIPYPVDRAAMDETTDILSRGISEARVGRGDKLRALKTLKDLVPP